MKSLLVSILLPLSFCIQAIGDGSIKTLIVKTAIYCDHCKKCESCGSRLENAVYDLKGVKRVDVNDKAMTVQVVYNANKVTPQDIRQAIAATGYDADDVEAPAEAVAKLDDCCKK